MKKTILTFALASLAIGSFASPAHANAAENRAVVEYGDLNLTSSAGQAVFERRLERAIQQVCQTQGSRSVRVASEARQCMQEKRAELAPVRDTIIAEARAEIARLAMDQR